MSKRDELAAVLSWSSGEFMRWSPDAHPDHNHWSWQGNGHGEGASRPFREQADAVLAWLGEQFDEGLRETVAFCREDHAGMFVDAGYICACGDLFDLPPDHDRHVADAALAVVRTRLGLNDAAQDAQDGARTASEVGSGSECQPDASRPGEVQPCDSEGER